MSNEAGVPPLIAGLLRHLALSSPSSTPIERLETHISWILLSDKFAYKIKKPVCFGFVDFSTLELRKHCCDEELRLNRRYSPDIYLSVVPITGTKHDPRLEDRGTPIEYAVKMLRFPSEALFDRLLELHHLMPEQVCKLAETVALFHRGLPRDETDPADRVKLVRATVEGNFSTLGAELSNNSDLSDLAMLHDWTRQESLRLEPLLYARASGGCFRECHGDLHLGNIVWLNGHAKLFDGIEFNADLRWIDTFSEIAFPVMDLEIRGAPDLAYALLNRYLDLTGDFAGIPLFDYYRLYRALVRAKVAILRSGQPGGLAENRLGFRSYARYGLSLIRRRQPSLVIMHGLSGSGKSRLASQLARTIPAICVRSDVERKRLCEEKRGDAAKPPGFYSPETTRQTYARLFNIARTVLSCGHSVILDATFLQRHHRSAALRVAASTGASFRMIDLNATPTVLRERVRSRKARGGDPSDADDPVITLQIRTEEKLDPGELERCICIDADSEFEPSAVLGRLNLPS